MKSKKINRFNILFVDTQIILTIISLILFVLYLFNDDYLLYFEILLGITLFSLSFNNYKIYQKKRMTFIYLFFGIMMFVFSILNILGV